jgi:hypothetical protein
MDVARDKSRLARIAFLGLGTLAGLVFALPVKTGSVSCPPQGEGRVQCLINEAWAPAGIKLAAAVFVVWLIGELLVFRLPALRRRWVEGERIVRREDGMGHDVVSSDPLLAAANRGIVPERKARWRVVQAPPSATAAAAVAAALPEQRMPWPDPEPRLAVPAPRSEPVPVPEPVAGVRALGVAERAARGRVRRLHVLSADEVRGRRLRRGTDPALVVSCWSDASSARALPDEVRSEVSA